MNKKVLGTVLGSCLFLCGDYGCAAPRDVVIGKTTESAGKTLVGLLKDPDVKNITFNGVTKSCSEWEELLKGYKGSGVGVSVYLVTALSRGVSKMGDDDISAAKDFGEKCRAKRVKRVCEFNDKLGGNSTIKSSSHAPGVTSPSGDKKDVELENSRSKFVNVSLNKYSGSSCVTELCMKDISRLCKDKSRLDEIVAKVESGYYDVLDESCFVDVVKHELQETVSVLEEILDRSGGKVEFKSKFDKTVARCILSAFGNDTKTCEDLGIVGFVNAVEKNSIKLDGVSSEDDIRDAIGEYNKKKLEDEEKEELGKMYKTVEARIAPDVAEKMCKCDGKINKEKCNEISELQLAENVYGDLYNGVSDLDDQVKIVEALLDINKRGLLDVALKNGVYVTCITGKSILLYANSDDAQKSMLNKENFVGIMSSAGDNFAEMVANYNKRKTENDKLAKLENGYKKTGGELIEFKVHQNDFSGKYSDCLLEVLADSAFSSECSSLLSSWVDSGESAQYVSGMKEFVSASVEGVNSAFLVLLHAVYNVYQRKERLSALNGVVKRVLRLVTSKLKGVTFDTSDDPAYQIAQTFKALKLCATKELTEMAIKTVKQYVVDPSVGSKINLDWVSGNIQDNGNVKIGDKEYDGGSFVVIFAHKTFSVAEFNAKSALDDKQTYLNDVAQGAGIKPVGPEAK